MSQRTASALLVAAVALCGCRGTSPTVYYASGNMLEVLTIALLPSRKEGRLEIAYANFGSGTIHKRAYDLAEDPSAPGTFAISRDHLTCGELSLAARRNGEVVVASMGAGRAVPFEKVSRNDIDSYLSTLQKTANESIVPSGRVISSDPVFVPRCN